MKALRLQQNRLVDITNLLNGRFAIMPMLLAWYKEHLNDIEVVAVGSSYTYHGIDLQTFGCPMINFSRASQDLYFSRCILEAVLKESGTALQRVLIGIAPWSFEHDESMLPTGWNNIWHYVTLARDTHHLSVSFEVLERIFREDFLNLIAGMRFDLNDFDHGRDLYGCKVFSESAEALIKGKKAAEAWNSKYYPATVGEMKRELLRMLDLCEQRGVEAFLLITPFTDLYRRHISSRLYNDFRRIVDEIKQLRQVRLLDYYDSKEFFDEDFIDESHLNYHGSVKLTNMLNKNLGLAVKLSSNDIRTPYWVHLSRAYQTYFGMLFSLAVSRVVPGTKLQRFDSEEAMQDVIIIYGAGKCGQEIQKCLHQYSVSDEKVLFCDTNRHGNVFAGKCIVSPNDLMNYDGCPIIISSLQYAGEIFAILHGLGIKSRNIFYFE